MSASTKDHRQTVPQIRFKGLEGEWKDVPLGEIFTKKTKKNKGSEEKFVLTNSATEGIVGQLDYFEKDIANQENLEGYYVVDVDDFVYNPRISKHAPVGPMKRNTYRKGIMSPLYTVLKPKVKVLGYFEKYFDTKKWHRYMNKIANYGARHDRMNIGQSDFLNMPIPVPQDLEQQKIADFLSSIDAWIENLREQNEHLETYKKGMMQKIFSQEIRFKDGNGKEFPEWEEKKISDVIKNYRLGGNYQNSELKTEHPLLKMGNLGRGKMNISKIEYIPENVSVNEEDRIKKNDLFFNTRNTLDLVGKVSIWRGELPKVYYNSNLMRLNFDLNEYMNIYFNSYQGLKSLRRIATGTTSVAAIYTKDLLRVKLRIPSLHEQQNIANFLETITETINAKENEIEKAKIWKRGLLQQLFV
jgi:type I restriction enzyme, S subunit